MITLNSITQSLAIIVWQTKAHIHTLIAIAALPWFVYVLTILSGKRLLLLGIIPRHWQGLPGIIFAPLLHADFNHLFFNTIPLLVLSNFLLIQGLPFFLWVTISITLLSGFAIWCFAKPGLHIGASALITGYWGLLVYNMYQHAGVMNSILGILCLYYFAGIFFGIFPNRKGVSWEGHLFGLLAGLATAYYSPF